MSSSDTHPSPALAAVELNSDTTTDHCENLEPVSQNSGSVSLEFLDDMNDDEMPDLSPQGGFFSSLDATTGEENNDSNPAHDNNVRNSLSMPTTLLIMNHIPAQVAQLLGISPRFSEGQRLVKEVDQTMNRVSAEISTLLLAIVVTPGANIQAGRMADDALLSLQLSYNTDNAETRGCMISSQIIGLLARFGRLPIDKLISSIKTILSARVFGRRDVLVLHALLYCAGPLNCTSLQEAEDLREIRQVFEVVLRGFNRSVGPIEDQLLFWPVFENSAYILMHWFASSLAYL